MMNKLAVPVWRSAKTLAAKALTAVFRLLPPRSMVGQLTLTQHIGVRIPGGQPILYLFALSQFPKLIKLLVFIRLLPILRA